MGCSSSAQSSPLLQNGLDPSKVMAVDKDTASKQHSVLEPKQQALIHSTWKCLSGEATLVGKRVFLRLFDKKPETKKMFPFKDVWGDDLITHPDFQRHAVRFMAMVGDAVHSMETVAEFNDRLLTLGRRHYHIDGFSPDYFETFLQSLLFIWQRELGQQMTPEVKVAWQTLFEHLLEMLRNGFKEESDRKAAEIDGVEVS